MRRKYNVELILWLKDNADKYTVDELVPIVNKKYKETYNRLQVQKLLVRNKIKYKYKNKNKSHNQSRLPIGYEYTKSDGMTLVKVGKNEWKYKQRYIYEQYYGIKLSSDMFVIFLDQDRTNFDINNLKAITRRESSILSNQKIFSKNPLATDTAIQVVKNIIKTKELRGEKYDNKIST